jgi:hypothetical protein
MREERGKRRDRKENVLGVFLYMKSVYKKSKRA